MKDRDYRFTFGQFKGTHISKVPDYYLEWIEKEKLTAGERLDTPLMKAINAELKARKTVTVKLSSRS